MPNCPGGEKELNAHHIKCWATHPALRLLVSNGITLCRKCHEGIRGRETEYEDRFKGLVGRSNEDVTLQLLMMRYGPKEE